MMSHLQKLIFPKRFCFHRFSTIFLGFLRCWNLFFVSKDKSPFHRFHLIRLIGRRIDVCELLRWRSSPYGSVLFFCFVYFCFVLFLFVFGFLWNVVSLSFSVLQTMSDFLCNEASVFSSGPNLRSGHVASQTLVTGRPRGNCLKILGLSLNDFGATGKLSELTNQQLFPNSSTLHPWVSSTKSSFKSSEALKRFPFPKPTTTGKRKRRRQRRSAESGLGAWVQLSTATNQVLALGRDRVLESNELEQPRFWG